jgi:hypothetical protein
MIEFRMTTDRKIRATAGVDKEGRFSLQFADANARFPGTLPGEYEVAVYPSGSATMEPLLAAKPVTIDPEGSENLEITVNDAP